MGDDGRRSCTSRVTVVVASVAAIVVVTIGLTARLIGPTTSDPYILWQFLIGLSAVSVGTFIGWKRPEHPMGALLIIAGAASWATFAGHSFLDWLFTYAPEQETLGRAVLALSISGWIVCRGVYVCFLPAAFPGGFAPGRAARALRWTSALAIVGTALAHARVNTFEHFAGEPSTGLAASAERFLPWGHRAILVCGALATFDLVRRTLRLDTAERRRQRWFVAATVALLLPLILGMFDELVHDFEWAIDRLELYTSTALPIVLAVGILRHGLLDIRVVLRRATVLTTVSLALLAIYAAAVAVVAALADDDSMAPAIVGAGIVAVSFSHVRGAVERFVARRLFGARDDPYAALAALGNRVEAAPPSEQALQTVTDTIRDELRIP